MKKEQINIRDPFVVYENGKFYLYGTRAQNFGFNTKGFDVYISENLKDWSEPIACFNSEKYGMNRAVNWAPEVHKYQGKFYMFATFKIESTGGIFGMKKTKFQKVTALCLAFVLLLLICRFIYLQRYLVYSDGQVLLAADALGMFKKFTPKFTKKYADIAEVATAGLTNFVQDVKERAFPGPEHKYKITGDPDEFQKLFDKMEAEFKASEE